MKTRMDYTIITVEYIGVYSNSMIAWGPITRFIEDFGFTAIPEYESRETFGIIREHDIWVYTNLHNVEELIPIIQQRYGDYPFIRSIYIKEQEGT